MWLTEVRIHFAGGIMRVPESFMSEKQKNEKAELFLKSYIEHEPSKIYTKVEENLLVIVLKGKKRLIYQDFETTISEGEYAIFHKGNYIMNQIISNDCYESLLIFMSDDFLKQIGSLRTKEVRIPTPFYQGSMSPLMQNEVNTIYEILDDKDYQDVIQLKVMELLIYMKTNDKTGNFENFLCSFSGNENFRNHIYQDYVRYQNITQIASEMHMSISTFKRTFQEEFGCSPHLWMNNQKLKKATMLLDTSDYSVTDIGFICGFSSLSTFMSQFKKKYGISPGIYRKQHEII